MRRSSISSTPSSSSTRDLRIPTKTVLVVTADLDARQHVQFQLRHDINQVSCHAPVKSRRKPKPRGHREVHLLI